MALKIPNPSEKISKYFTWGEALYLPSYNRMATEADGLTQEMLDQLKVTFTWMDKVREYFGKAIKVHIAWRSVQYHQDLYKEINAKKRAKGQPEVRVPTKSAHLDGFAVDFSVQGISCDEAKQRILDDNKLEEWNLRMEDNGKGAGWVHLDSKKPGPSGRFFKP